MKRRKKDQPDACFFGSLTPFISKWITSSQLPIVCALMMIFPGNFFNLNNAGPGARSSLVFLFCTMKDKSNSRPPINLSCLRSNVVLKTEFEHYVSRNHLLCVSP